MSNQLKSNGNSTLEQYENLANAIIISAVNDYKGVLRFKKNDPDREKFVKNSLSEKFFRSEWFKILTNVDGEYLINKLREEVWESDD